MKVRLQWRHFALGAGALAQGDLCFCEGDVLIGAAILPAGADAAAVRVRLNGVSG
jgi:hypothetical protein